ncbi:unnamed protein product, partial [Rotaria magnacalcarata]
QDPSDNFIALRDLVSLELCHKYLPDLFSKDAILKTNWLTNEIFDKTHAVCKISKEEIRPVYEMYFLRSIDRSDDEQLKRFRLIVKKLLFHSLQYYQTMLRAFDKYHLNSFFMSNILFK